MGQQSVSETLRILAHLFKRETMLMKKTWMRKKISGLGGGRMFLLQGAETIKSPTSKRASDTSVRCCQNAREGREEEGSGLQPRKRLPAGLT